MTTDQNDAPAEPLSAAQVEALVRAGDGNGLRAGLRKQMAEDAVRFLMTDPQALAMRTQGVPVVKACLRYQLNVPAEAFEDLLYGPDPVLVAAAASGYGYRHSAFSTAREIELATIFLRYARRRRVEGVAWQKMAWTQQLPPELMVLLMDVIEAGFQDPVSTRAACESLSRRLEGVPVPMVVLRRLWARATRVEKQALAPGLVRQRLADEAFLLEVIGCVDKDDWWLVGAVENPAATSAVRAAIVNASVRSSTRTRLAMACRTNRLPDTLLVLAGAGRSAAAQDAAGFLPAEVVLTRGSVTARVNLAVIAGEQLKAKAITLALVLALAGDPEVRVRAALAGAKGLPAEVLTILATDGSAQVRNAVLKNRLTPFAVVTDLLGDTAGSVRELATTRFGAALNAQPVT